MHSKKYKWENIYCNLCKLISDYSQKVIRNIIQNSDNINISRSLNIIYINNKFSIKFTFWRFNSFRRTLIFSNTKLKK